MKWLFLCLAAVGLLACSTAKYQVVENGATVYRDQYVGKEKIRERQNLAFFSTTAQRRIVVINGAGKFCAEPSPDAVDDLLSSVTSSLKASAEDGKGQKAELIADVAKTLMTNSQFLLERSQGLQLYRDGSFALCTSYANGYIGAEEYGKQLKNLLDASAELIGQELEKNAENRGKYLSDVKAKQDFKTRLEEFKQIQDVTKKPKDEPEAPADGKEKKPD